MIALLSPTKSYLNAANSPLFTVKLCLNSNICQDGDNVADRLAADSSEIAVAKPVFNSLKVTSIEPRYAQLIDNGRETHPSVAAILPARLFRLRMKSDSGSKCNNAEGECGIAIPPNLTPPAKASNIISTATYSTPL